MFTKVNNNEINKIALLKTKNKERKEKELVPSPSVRKKMIFFYKKFVSEWGAIQVAVMSD